jgi:hypothetical protein
VYENIGAKIKGLAKVIAWIGIIGSVITGIIYIVMGINSYYGGGAQIGIGIGVMIGGALSSWISSWFTYGFGELIEKTAETARNTEKLISYSSLTAKTGNDKKLKTLLSWKEGGLISEEEFEMFKIKRHHLQEPKLLNGDITERLRDLKNEFESGEITLLEYDYKRETLLDEL